MTNLQIKQMTTAEKISAMECLWDDLCHQAQEITSPNWHQETLARREKALKQGKDAFTDWEVAQKKIRDSL